MSVKQNKHSIPPPPLGRDKVGRYDVMYPIAQGGMASVYAGRLSGIAGFEKLVAIKIIHPHLASNSKFVDMFLDEARLAAQIHHPNVGEITEVGEDDSLLFMVGELIRGESLRSLFRRARTMQLEVPQSLSAFIVSQVCQGLHAAHELVGPDGQSLNLVHRDVSPRNILISYDGFVKLIDFGVAWAQTRSSHTAEGVVKGKIGFMSPEQVQGLRLDRRSDVFSLGVVLYLSLTGKLPFSARSDLERLDKLLNGRYIKPQEANPKINNQLQGIIEKSIATNRNTRFANMAEMSQALEDFIRSSGEETGMDTLRKFMRRLFAEEHQAQQERVRKWRMAAEQSQKLIPESAFEPGEHSSGQHRMGDSARYSAGSLSPEASHSDIEAGIPKRRYLKSAMGFAAAALIVGAGVIFLNFAPKSKDPTDQIISSVSQNISVSQAGIVPSSADRMPESGDKALPDDGDGERQEEDRQQTHLMTIQLEPPSASVTLDAKYLGPGVRELPVPADGRSHELTFSAEGYQSVTEIFVADRDRQISVVLTTVETSNNKARSASKKKKKKSADLGLKSSPY